tara:strand:+ start:4256 stop:5587 length:1332 start_codon:yes stop_codon:yes gene_type:complete
MFIKKIMEKIEKNEKYTLITSSYKLYKKTYMNNISDIKFYYNCVENYRFFIDDEEKNLAEKLYLNSKKIKNNLQRFINICKNKTYKKYEYDTDLRFIPLKNYDKTEIINIIIDKTIYSFRILDLIHLLKISLYNNDNMFPTPIRLKNPYTNIYFKKYNLYNILIAFSKTKYIIPETILIYYKCDFDIAKFKESAFPILQENAIDCFVKKGPIRDLYDYIITICHDFRKETNYVIVKSSISIFKKSEMVHIFSNILKFYLKHKYLCNPLKKKTYKKKLITELKEIIRKHCYKNEFLKLSNLERIRYDTSNLITEINNMSNNINENIPPSSTETIPTINNVSLLNTEIENLENEINILENEEELTNLSQQEPLQENNFIFRRRRTSIYLPPISTNNSNNYENTIITNQNPFRATNEIARSPSNIQNNVRLTSNIRNRLSFGVRRR